MTEEKTGKRIVKATLEAVFKSQERLRKHLEQLIQENRPLNNSDERDLFFRELTYSTLGLGSNHQIIFNTSSLLSSELEAVTKCNSDTKDGCQIGGVYIRNNLEWTARWLAYQDASVVRTPMSSSYHAHANFPIGLLWNCLLDNLFYVFPVALERATNLSREQDEKNKTRGFVIHD